MRLIFSALLLVSFCSMTGNAFAADEKPLMNPVLTDPFAAADCGVMKFNGKYYIAGNFLMGDMLVSTDLVNWGDRTHVFSMNNDWATGEAGRDWEIHACDPSYHDGTFHLYWSVNRGDLGVVQIGHAVADTPMGPYVEPVTETWFDGKIDANLFRDDDGSFTFYTVKFTSGNVIYGQPMADPWTLTGSPVSMLSALPNTWEWLDHKVNEAQFVFKYRDLYYLIYNSNHTGYGKYALGCATATSPLGFRNETKYPDPVVGDIVLPDGDFRHSPGQPTVIRGPNGFEWWLIYFAESRDHGRQQAIDRVHFFDRRLWVDGPTAPGSPGYHPEPRMPTLLDLFETSNASSLGSHWEPFGGQWAIRDGEARQTNGTGSYRTIALSAPARHYVVESGVRLLDDTGEKAGVVAYWRDADNWMIVALDQLHGAWYWKKREQGVETVVGTPLPEGYNFQVWRKLRVERNGSEFRVLIDDRKAPGTISPIATGFTEPGLAGLYTEESAAAFDGFLYTVGWDETGSAIRGWGDTMLGQQAVGIWESTGEGLHQTSAAGRTFTFKGDRMPSYEFSAQVTQTMAAVDGEEPRGMGILPVYIDDDNYLRADIDPVKRVLRVSGRRNGADLDDRVAPLPERFLSPTSEEAGQAWRYTTSTPASNWTDMDFDDTDWLVGPGGFGTTGTPWAVVRTTWDSSDIWLRRAFTLDSVPHWRPRLWIHHDEDVLVTINGVPAWHGTGYTTKYRQAEVSDEARAALREGENVLAVHCRQTVGGQYIDVGLYLPHLVETPGSWNLRAVKLSDRVILFVNGIDAMTVDGEWPASRVGLGTENLTARFTGITCFRIGSQTGKPETSAHAGWAMLN